MRRLRRIAGPRRIRYPCANQETGDVMAKELRRIIQARQREADAAKAASAAN